MQHTISPDSVCMLVTLHSLQASVRLQVDHSSGCCVAAKRQQGVAQPDTAACVETMPACTAPALRAAHVRDANIQQAAHHIGFRSLPMLIATLKLATRDPFGTVSTSGSWPILPMKQKALASSTWKSTDGAPGGISNWRSAGGAAARQATFVCKARLCSGGAVGGVARHSSANRLRTWHGCTSGATVAAKAVNRVHKSQCGMHCRYGVAASAWHARSCVKSRVSWRVTQPRRRQAARAPGTARDCCACMCMQTEQ